MSVATDYPSRTDANGITWYRPAFDTKSSPGMWGWTSCPEQAHPDYLCAGCFGHPSRCECPRSGDG